MGEAATEEVTKGAFAYFAQGGDSIQKKTLAKLFKQPANCYGSHGLTKGVVDKNYRCDECGGSIESGSEAWSCRTCDFDNCNDCYVKMGGKV